MNEEFDVGERLKMLRNEAGLTQRQLAERAGVPHGQISMVESNRSSPSVASLRKILGGIPMSMAAFFEPEVGSAEPQVFFTHNQLIDLTSRIGASDSGAAIAILQVGQDATSPLQLLHETYAPGADTGDSMLEHASHEAGMVIAGEVEVTVGQEVRVLKSGDAYTFDSRRPHRFRNLGELPAQIISACTPPYL